jgi:hypothetical protein
MFFRGGQISSYPGFQYQVKKVVEAILPKAAPGFFQLIPSHLVMSIHKNFGFIFYRSQNPSDLGTLDTESP